VQYLLVLIAGLILYGLTCGPAILWQDSGLFVYRIWHNDLQGNLGIALSHPLYIMVGIVAKAIPVGELAWRVNMISAVFGAIAVANLFLLLRLWLNRFWPGMIAVITLAVSWTFWQNAVIAEVYTMYAAQLFTELLVLFWYVRSKRTSLLYLLGLLNGLSIANHLWSIFPLACFGIFLIFLIVKKEVKLSALPIFIICWVIGALPYEYLIAKEIIQTGDIAAVISSALFGNGWQGSVINASMSLKIVIENMIFIALNFPTPTFFLLFAGIWSLYKKAPSKAFANILVGITAMFLLFAFRYKVPDRHAFFLPFYCMVSILIGLGAHWLFEKRLSKTLIAVVLILALLPVGSYFVTPDFARNYYKALGQRRQRPYRDEYRYWLVPWKNNYTGAQQFASEVLTGADEKAVIYAFTTDAHPLLYSQQVKGIRPDVVVVSDHDCSEGNTPLDETEIKELVSQNRLFTTSDHKGYYPYSMIGKYGFVKQGLLYKVFELENSESNVNDGTK